MSLLLQVASHVMAPQNNTTGRKRRKLVGRGLTLVTGAVLSYFCAAIIGLIPANRDFQHADTGVDVFVVSNGIHTDFIVPTQTATIDWRQLFPATDFTSRRSAPHIQIGWGDRQFYIETPTWADLRYTTLVKSMFLPTPCTMHVAYVAEPRPSEHCRHLRLSNRQYELLVEQLTETLKLDEDKMPIQIPNTAYYHYDAFYEADGVYHLFNTCNCWTGRTLRGAEVQVGIWTPFPQSVIKTVPLGPAE